MHWEYLIPIGPKTIWKFLSLRPTHVGDDKRLRKINQSFGLVYIPIALLLLAYAIWATVASGDLSFEWPDLSSDFDGVTFTWKTALSLAMLNAWSYWIISVLSRVVLAHRAMNVTVAAELISNGINPAETAPKRKKK